MAFPTTGIIDDFNRADLDSLGAAYSADPAVQTQSDFAVVSNRAANRWLPCSVWRNDATYGPDTEVYVTCPVLPSGGSEDFRVYARLQVPGTAGADGYMAVANVSGSTWDLWRITNATLGFLATAAQAWSVSDTLGMEVLGTGATVTLNVYRNGSLITTYDDTDASRITAAGYIGFGMYDTAYPAGRLDDFGGGTVVVTTGAVPLLRVTRSNLSLA